MLLKYCMPTTGGNIDLNDDMSIAVSRCSPIYFVHSHVHSPSLADLGQTIAQVSLYSLNKVQNNITVYMIRFIVNVCFVGLFYKIHCLYNLTMPCKSIKTFWMETQMEKKYKGRTKCIENWNIHYTRTIMQEIHHKLENF